MDNLERLEVYQLMDIVEPVTEPMPISFLPQTIGWLYLLIALIIICIIVIWRKHRIARQRQHRVNAIALINELDTSEGALAISSILKRCALYDFPRQVIAPLTGQAWADFLNQQFDNQEQFKDFYNYTDSELTNLKILAENWLSHYRVN